MESRTVTVMLEAPSQRAFEYLSQPENLPRWATEFARELRVEGGRYTVVNGLGEFLFRIDADEATGVIDMYAGPSEEELALFPTRVVPLSGDRTAYTFTMFQAPGMPDELFESQYQSLRRELENVKREVLTA